MRKKKVSDSDLMFNCPKCGNKCDVFTSNEGTWAECKYCPKRKAN